MKKARREKKQGHFLVSCSLFFFLRGKNEKRRTLLALAPKPSLAVASMSASSTHLASCCSCRRPALGAPRQRAVVFAFAGGVAAGIGGQRSVVDVNFRARASRASAAPMASLRPWSSRVRPLDTRERIVFYIESREKKCGGPKEEEKSPLVFPPTSTTFFPRQTSFCSPFAALLRSLSNQIPLLNNALQGPLRSPLLARKQQQQQQHVLRRKNNNSSKSTTTTTTTAAVSPLAASASLAAASSLPLAMVNVDFSPALVLGMGLIGGGLALYQLRRARPSVSRDFDVVASSVAIFSGGILVFQGWRLDPLLLFCQLLTAGMALSFAVEALRLREEVVEGGGGASEGLGGGAALPPPYDTRVRGGRQRGSSEGASFQQQQQQQPQDDYYYDNNNSSYYGPGAGLPPPRQGSVSPEDYFAGGSNSSSRWGGAAERGGAGGGARASSSYYYDEEDAAAASSPSSSSGYYYDGIIDDDGAGSMGGAGPAGSYYYDDDGVSASGSDLPPPPSDFYFGGDGGEKGAGSSSAAAGADDSRWPPPPVVPGTDDWE